MRLAPDTQLTARVVPLHAGANGVAQTLRVMRALVRAYRVDPEIRSAATTAIFLTPERSTRHEVDALYTLVRDTVRYVRDVHEVETLQSPDKTIALRVGDCDDQAVLLASLLESVGYPTRFVAAGYAAPGELDHVYLQVCLDGEWLDADPTERMFLGWAPPDPVTLLVEHV